VKPSTPMPAPGFGPALEPAYSLLSEPWLPVRWADGTTRPIGLRELFARSHEITSLEEPSPPAFVALHRLLLAITHRALTMQVYHWTDEDRAKWYLHGLPPEAFSAYFDRWQERFWLFHPTYPFMQVAALADAPQTRVAKPWTQISLTSASGNNPVVFDHSLDSAPRDVAAPRILITMLGYLQFAPSGTVKVLRGSDKMGPLCDSAVAIPIAATLGRSLLLSLHPSGGTERARIDLPAWERAPPNVGQLIAAGTVPTSADGPNDAYTRLTRAVLLLPAAPLDTISRLRFAEGLAISENSMAPDPMHSYQQRKDKSLRLRFSEGRATWRDLPALLPAPEASGSRPAAVLSWARNLLNAVGEWEAEVQVVIAGTATEALTKGKQLQVRREHFRIPAGAMSAADAAASLRDQLRRAEECYLSLKRLAVETAAQALPDSTNQQTKKRAGQSIDLCPLEATFFARAELGLARLLGAVARGDTDDAFDLWSATLVASAIAGWTVAGAHLGESARALRARASSEGRFLALVGTMRPKPASHIKTTSSEKGRA
jgi:CRISPR system Cascade subunit CasA